MKKNILKITSTVLCITLLACCLTACGKKKKEISISDISVITYGGAPAVVTAQTDGFVRVDVDSATTDIEFNFAKFFEEHSGFVGKGFYFTRDDVKKGDGTLVKGYAWSETETGTAAARKYKKLGYEDDQEITAMTKTEIEQLEGREGEVRMYFLKDGTRVAYIDPTTGSSLATGETRVTFRLHGNDGHVATLKLLVNKSE